MHSRVLQLQERCRVDMTLRLLVAVTFAVGGGSSSLPAVAAENSSQTATARVLADADSATRRSFPDAIALQPRGELRSKIFRESDDRARHDDRALAALGIHKYESKHLRLYTDIAPELAQKLPPLMDAAYAAWEDYFGPLPPDREGAVFQMTGYVMSKQSLFRETGLIPENLPGFPHGRNRGRTFWMNDQAEDYYRRHLLVHEGTHCFTQVIPNPLRPQVWFMEGIAELFGTHRIDPDGKVQFRVMPADREQFRGWGRTQLVADDVKAGRLRTLRDVQALPANDFLRNEPYAWSWALCKFLDAHPRYRERFREFSRQATAGGNTSFDQLFAADKDALEEEWLLFGAHLCLGYDVELAAIDFRPGRRLPAGEAANLEIAAARGWQSSGVQVAQGKKYRVTAQGRFVIAGAAREGSGQLSGIPVPGKPWECEPQGVSIRYHGGKPLGMVVAAIRAEPRPTTAPQTTMLDVVPIGREAEFTAASSGTLYLRVNDNWNELHDNSGSVRIAVVELR